MDFKLCAKKTLCAGLCSALMLGNAAEVGFSLQKADAAGGIVDFWDGYTNASKSGQKYQLVDFSNIASVEAVDGIVASGNYAKNGYSAYWGNLEKNNKVSIKSFADGVPTDWSDVDKIVIDMYSAKMTGQKLKLVAYSRNDPETGGISYYYKDITIDWEGYNKVEMSVQGSSASRAPDITQMQKFEIVGHGGWDISATPGTELWIRDVYITTGNAGDGYMGLIYDAEQVSEAYEYLNGGVAFFGDGQYAVTNKGKQALSYSVDYVNEKIFVPLNAFKDYFGAQVKYTGGTYEITLNGKTLSGEPAYEKDGFCYVNGEEVALKLGLIAFSDRRLLCMSTDEAINNLRRVESLGVNEYAEIISEEAFQKTVDTKSFTPEDCDAVIKNWREFLVGSEETNDLSDEDIAAKIKIIDTNCETARNKIAIEPTISFFETNKMSSTDDLHTQYKHVQSMAYAYACYGSKYYKDESVYNDIVSALDWLGANYYNAESRAQWEAVMTGLSNWHVWDVDVPQCIIETLICLDDRFTLEQRNEYLKYYYTRFVKANSTAANYSHQSQLIMGSAALRYDYELVYEMTQLVPQTLLYVDDNKRIVENKIVLRDYPVDKKGSGFYTDGSYVFHTFHAMTGSYGQKHYKAITEFYDVVAGTAFEINSALKFQIPEFFFDTFDPVTYKMAMFRAVMGRATNPATYGSAANIYAHAFVVADAYDDATRDRMYSIIKGACKDSPYTSMVVNALPLGEIAGFKAMLADDTIKARDDESFSKTLYNMDKTFHTNNNFGLAISMSSRRIFDYESINGENLDGWYLGAGRTEWMLPHSTLNANSQYWANINHYRIPGTTVDSQERQLYSIHQGNEFLSSKDFVGGVSLDNLYSASAMDYEAHHYDEPFGVDNGLHGGKAPVVISDLTAKKSYYMFDDGFACLGAGVNAKNNNNSDVITVVDNLSSTKVQQYSENSVTGKPYTIKTAVADNNTEPENSDVNAIDGDYSTKWAGNGGEIVFDVGEDVQMGFVLLSMQNGDRRQQNIELLVSNDGVSYESVFKGASSGKTSFVEPYDLKGKTARYLKLINNGNSAGSGWLSLTECSIYPPNTDGSVGVVLDEIYGIDPIVTDSGILPLKGDDVNLTGTKWLNFNSTAGYIFPQYNSGNPGILKTHWTKSPNSFFELWFDHGVNPTDSTYTYIVLPGADENETKAFAEAGHIEVLSNTSKVQAVRDKRTNVTYITFWVAGSFNGITVTEPCMVITKESDNGYDIAVSDPSQKLDNLTVTVDKALGEVIKADECAKVENFETMTKMTYDLTDAVGRTLVIKFDRR